MHQNGQTPFMLACEAGHVDTIKFLLECDCSLVSTKDVVSVLSICTCACANVYAELLYNKLSKRRVLILVHIGTLLASRT